MSKSRAKSKGRKSKKGSSEEAEHIVEFGRAGFSFNYGCQFPVEEAANQIKIKATLSTNPDKPKDIYGSSSIYLAAVLEYIAAELCELAGNVARDSDSRTIGVGPRSSYLITDGGYRNKYGMDLRDHLILASHLDRLMKKDKEADQLFKKIKPQSKPSSDYSINIYQVLAQVHPDFKISNRAMHKMNCMINGIQKHIINKASLQNNGIVSDTEIQNIVRSSFPGELAKHAVSEGFKAVKKYLAAPSSPPPAPAKTVSPCNIL